MRIIIGVIVGTLGIILLASIGWQAVAGVMCVCWCFELDRDKD